MKNQKYNIGEHHDVYPTIGLQGVEEGTIAIHGMVTYEGLPAGYPKEAWLVDEPEEDLDLIESPWYIYRYTDSSEFADTDIVYYMPQWALEEVIQEAKKQREAAYGNRKYSL